jgi:hypothetical protein
MEVCQFMLTTNDMKFSNLDIINQEKRIIRERREIKNEKFFPKIIYLILNRRYPKHRFRFYVPQYLYLRACSLCRDIEREIDDTFKIGELAEILYIDFLELVTKSNDIHMIYKRLAARDLAPVEIKPYQTEEAYDGAIFEEVRGYEEIETRIDHKEALKGEFLLRDMVEIYTDHTFTLENIFEIVFCDYINDYRRGLIKNPLPKILHYLDY